MRQLLFPTESMPNQFVILDRDGTLIKERHYLSDPRHVELIEGVAEGLRRLLSMGLELVVLTNQSGIGRGLLGLEQLAGIHLRLYSMLRVEEVRLGGIYFCPHVPQDSCNCRKPAVGLVERATQDLGLDPRASYVIGDRACDIQLAENIGARSFLVRTGHGASTEKQQTLSPDYIVDDLPAAVPIIEGLLRQQLSPYSRQIGHYS